MYSGSNPAASRAATNEFNIARHAQIGICAVENVSTHEVCHARDSAGYLLRERRDPDRSRFTAARSYGRRVDEQEVNNHEQRTARASAREVCEASRAGVSQRKFPRWPQTQEPADLQ